MMLSGEMYGLVVRIDTIEELISSQIQWQSDLGFQTVII